MGVARTDGSAAVRASSSNRRSQLIQVFGSSKTSVLGPLRLKSSIMPIL